jgi:hypothetical protein
MLVIELGDENLDLLATNAVGVDERSGLFLQPVGAWRRHHGAIAGRSRSARWAPLRGTDAARYGG